MKNIKDFLKRFGNAIYLLIFALAIILFILAYYQAQEGIWHDLLVDLSASFVATALLFFLVVSVLGYDPQTQLIEEKLEHIRHDINSLRGVTEFQPGLKWEKEFLMDAPFNIYIKGAKELFISGGHLYNLFLNQNEVLWKWLRQKRTAKMMIILENPETARDGRTPVWIVDSNENRESYAQDIERSLKMIARLREEFPHKIEVRLTAEVPSLTVMIIDRSKAVVCLNLYFGKPESRPVFELSKNVHSEWFKLFEERYCNRLWADSKPPNLNDYLKAPNSLE